MNFLIFIGTGTCTSSLRIIVTKMPVAVFEFTLMNGVLVRGGLGAGAVFSLERESRSGPVETLSLLTVSARLI